MVLALGLNPAINLSHEIPTHRAELRVPADESLEQVGRI
jgi:hypothetical protein